MQRNFIGDMPKGRVFYTVSWALQVDHQRQLWINPRHTFDTERHGTVALAIERVDDGIKVVQWGDRDYAVPREPVAVPPEMIPVVEIPAEERTVRHISDV